MAVTALIILFISLRLVAAAPYMVFPPTAKVVEGEGMVLQVLPADTPLDQCIVRFGGSSMTFTSENTTENPGNVKYRGKGVEKGECGVIIQSYNHTLHNGNWVFQMITDGGDTRVAMASLSTDFARNPPIDISAEIGQKAIIPCKINPLLHYYCTLRNPIGEVVRSGADCNVNLETVRMSDVGTWKCINGRFSAVNEDVVNITVSVTVAKSLDIGQLEEESSQVIYCNSPNEVTFCRFERPDGLGLVMSDGRNYERYTYNGKGLKSYECGISINKPLLEEDVGTWICTIGLRDGTRTGGFITIKEPDHSKPGPGSTDLLEELTHDTVYVLHGTSLTLKCSVETPLDYCWFLHPNGTRFHPHPDLKVGSWSYSGEGLLLGQCGITINESQFTDMGTWVCGLGVRDERQLAFDLQQKVPVVVAETSFLENRTETNVSPGESAILTCRSLKGEALQFCNFIAPNGTGYNLSPRREPSAMERFTYYGAGLDHGECGIMINPVIPTDFGQWQCGTMLVGSKDGKEMVRTLSLQAPSILSSSGLGIIIGVIAAAVVVCAVVIYHWRSKKSILFRRPVIYSATSDDSDDLNLNINAPVAQPH